MRVTAIVGSYRRGGIVESAVDELLAAARAQGAEVEKIHLLDRQVEFCTNCRTCSTNPDRTAAAAPFRMISRPCWTSSTPVTPSSSPRR